MGLGLGGFFDGIVFHQILQWHHLVCRTETCHPTSVADLQQKNFLDGLFHAACWVLSVAGMVTLAAAGRTPFRARTVVGTAVLGWGVFNLVEGLINHQMLGIHHVRPGPDQFAWDMGFLAWGAAMVVVGWWVARRSTGPVGGEFQRR